MSNKALTPLVDFSYESEYRVYDKSIGEYVPPTTGTVTFYLATSPDAESPAHPSLTGTAEYVGDYPGRNPGIWFCGFDASLLTFALLDSVFLTPNGKTIHPYLIVLKPSGSRDAMKLDYKRVKLVTAA